MRKIENKSKKYANGSKWISNNSGEAEIIGKSDRIFKRKGRPDEKPYFLAKFEDGTIVEVMSKELRNGRFRSPNKKNVEVEKEISVIESKEDRILIIPDLHAPFIKEGYLEFCKSIYNKYKCKSVVMMGDLIDNHASSFYDTDPDGWGAATELEEAKKQIKEFYKTFPDAKVCIGNHDRIILRRAFASGISKAWIKDMKVVLEVPNWEFKDHFIINERLYYHGDGSKPRVKIKEEGMSVIAGHRHSESYIEFLVNSSGKKTFAIQLGSGIDRTKYAFAYGKFYKPPHINCGVIIDDVPIIEYMEE